jgi:ATP-dependent Clp protease protease subunit
MEDIERDTERDFYMSGQEAMKYGIVDHVLDPFEDKDDEDGKE